MSIFSRILKDLSLAHKREVCGIISVMDWGTVERQITPSQGGIRGFFRRVTEAFSPVNNRVPLESINDKTAAWAIDTFLGNPLQERTGGNRWANGFSIPTLLSNTGSVSPIETDYMKAFPKEHAAWRQATQRLVDEGILQAVPLKSPDLHNETIHYIVVNPERLKESAEQGRVFLKR